MEESEAAHERTERRRADPRVHRAAPGQAGKDEYVVKGTGIPVWALVGHAPARNNDLAKVAEDYWLPVEAVQAAFAYYRRHKAIIDNRLERNEIALNYDGG